MIPKREKTTDIASEIAQGKLFKKRLMKLVQEVTDRFINGEPLNNVIGEVAKRENFSQIQIQRLVEESNTVAYNKRYDQVKKDKDRRITFELANLEKTLQAMGADAPSKEDNPNWVTGKSGEGSIDKKASSIESGHIHNPNSRIDEKREKLEKKKRELEKTAATKELDRLMKKTDADIFKIANSLVMTERLYKTANTIFNTLLSDTELSDETIEMVEKKAHQISNHLAETGRANSNFVLSLKVNPTEKIANTLLGENSLTNKDSTKVEVPKVAPTIGVSQYQQLIDLAKEIQRQQAGAVVQQNKINLNKEGDF